MVLNCYFEYLKVDFCSANRTNFYGGKVAAFETCPHYHAYIICKQINCNGECIGIQIMSNHETIILG
jgi:hypothetical protein